MLGTAHLAALPGLARRRASAATRPAFDGARVLREDTLDKLSAESLRVVGTVILESLPAIEAELARRVR